MVKMESIGSLIDQLITTNLKIWHLIDLIETEKDNNKVAEASRKNALLNRERNRLINELNLLLEGKEHNTNIKV